MFFSNLLPGNTDQMAEMLSLPAPLLRTGYTRPQRQSNNNGTREFVTYKNVLGQISQINHHGRVSQQLHLYAGLSLCWCFDVKRSGRKFALIAKIVEKVKNYRIIFPYVRTA